MGLVPFPVAPSVLNRITCMSVTPLSSNWPLVLTIKVVARVMRFSDALTSLCPKKGKCVSLCLSKSMCVAEVALSKMLSLGQAHWL